MTRMMPQHVRALPMMFGAPGRQLFGMLHAPADTSMHRAAVLLCYPFGQEAIRAHRTFKVLGERLSRAGHPALRFDYFGSGDAAGEDTDVTISTLCDDVLAANAALRHHAGERPIIWLGLGFGATVAWLTAAKDVQVPQKLLLWDPILDGKDYLAELRRRHDAFFREVFSVPPRGMKQVSGITEAIGFSISDDFASEIEAVTVARMPAPPADVHTVLVTSRETPQNAALMERCHASALPLRHVDLPHDIDWMVENIEQGSLVPAAALQGILKLAGEEA